MSSSALRVAWGITARSLKLIPRLPSTFIPSLVMPVFFIVSFSGAFAGLVALRGFPAKETLDWFLPFTTLQGCAFAGITTGLGVARDLESGFYDRLLVSPAPRGALLAGPLLASVFRALIPLVMLITLGLAFGAHVPGGPLGLVMLAVGGLLLALIAGEWAVGVALRTKTTQSAPLVQMLLFFVIFLSPAMMPLELLTGWVKAVAEVNPMTEILQMTRQGFLGDVTWAATWPGLLALTLGAAALGLFAHRGLKNVIP